MRTCDNYVDDPAYFIGVVVLALIAVAIFELAFPSRFNVRIESSVGLSVKASTVSSQVTTAE